MSVKFSQPATQYLSAADTAALTFPNSDWALSFVVVFDGPTAGNPQYVLSTGPFASAGSLQVIYYASDAPSFASKFVVQLDTAGTAAPALQSAGAILSGKYLFVIQRSGTTVSMRHCPILSASPSDGSSVVQDSSATLSMALDGSGGLAIGCRTDGANTRGFGQSLARVFRYDGTLTDTEVAKLAYGMEAPSLGKNPAWYVRMDNAADITDIGAQGNAVTAHGTLVNGTAPGFGYTSTAVAPAITSDPVIVGGAPVGSASSVTLGPVTGSPTPTGSFQWNYDGVPISGATGTTHTSVSADLGKAKTFSQTASNGVGSPVTRTSAPVTVTEATSTVDVTQITAERGYQQIGGSAVVPLSGTYTGPTAPTSIEYQLYAADGTAILVPWTAIAGATISGGNWSGSPSIARGGMYRQSVRSKNGSTVLATSNIKANLFGVGDFHVVGGSSSGNRLFQAESGTNFVANANIRQYRGGAWGLMTSNGCATPMANYLNQLAGYPIFMISCGVEGSTLQQWLNVSQQSAWPFTDFTNTINAIGGKITSVIFPLGSNDAALNLVTSRQSHLTNLRQLRTNISSITGQTSIPYLLWGGNRRPATDNTQADYVHMAENDLGDDPNVVHMQILDIEIYVDKVHPSVNGFTQAGARAQWQLGQFLYGDKLVHRGPKITSFSYSGNTVAWNMQYRNGTDFSPVSGINGFTISDSDPSGVAPTITSVARISATQGLITCNRALVNPVVKHLAGSAPVSAVETAPTNEVFDNGTVMLPMTAETDMVAQSSAGDTTAPTLTNAAGTAISSTSANGSVTTNEAGGTLYYLVNSSSTSTAAQVKAGSSQAVSAVGMQSVSAGGLSGSTLYYFHFLQTDAAGNNSTVLDSAGFTTAATPDTTAPVLSAATATPNGASAATGSVTTNEGNGTLYYLASTLTSLTAAQVKAGTTQAISSAGAKGVAVSGLAALTIYYLYFLHRDAAGNDSAVLRSSSFTTAAAPTNPSTIDATKVPASRTVVFPGNKRVVTF